MQQTKETSSSTVSENEDSNLAKANLKIKEESQEENIAFDDNKKETNNFVIKIEEKEDKKTFEDQKPLKLETILECNITDENSGEKCKIKEEKNEISVKNEIECEQSEMKIQDLEENTDKLNDEDEKSQEIKDRLQTSSSDLDLAVQETLNKIIDSVIEQTSSQQDASSDEESINYHEISFEVCNYLIDSVCKINEDKVENEVNQYKIDVKDEMNNDQQKKCTDHQENHKDIKEEDENEKFNDNKFIENENMEHGPANRGKKSQRGGRTLRGRGRPKGRAKFIPVVTFADEVSEKKYDNEEESSENVPIKRSRRIQALQEKKSAELAEQMKREQQKLEEMAKKRTEKSKEREQNKINQEHLNGNSKKARKIVYKVIAFIQIEFSQIY